MTARAPAIIPAVVVTAAVVAAVAWFFAAAVFAGTVVSPVANVFVAIAILYFAAISVVLSLIDLKTHRLPNAIVLPSYLVSFFLLTLACVLGGDWAALLRAAIAMVVLFGFYALLRAVRPDGMGGGDVKLAGLVGIQLGWFGAGSVIVGTLAAFILGGLFGAILLLTRRAGRRTAIPFGPWMLAGAWVGIAAGEPVSSWYTGLLVGA
ncbi:MULTISPECIES: A24 family peptidase [unclassified Microbacterium]|uniref:prepilin peptidase n=1 Tax=unclassified Microbacterium TaxID=2609290 RepID=UPI000C2BE115|nr:MULTISPECIES: A24 family peptidase [unclassified Microbacterium]